MTERCKLNPCCGDPFNCTPPAQFKPRESYAEYKKRTIAPNTAPSPAPVATEGTCDPLFKCLRTDGITCADGECDIQSGVFTHVATPPTETEALRKALEAVLPYAKKLSYSVPGSYHDDIKFAEETLLATRMEP